MIDSDLTPAKDGLGRDILVYAKGKAPKTKPRYTTPELTGGEPVAKTPAPTKADKE